MKKIFLSILLLLLLIFVGKNCFYYYKRITLLNTYNRIAELYKGKNYKEVYGYLTPEERRKTSFQEYLNWESTNISDDKVVSANENIKSIKIKNNEGYVTVYRLLCYSKECTGHNRAENTMTLIFDFVNGKWYMPLDNTTFCNRDTPHTMPEEFNRAISLIVQRLKNDKNSNFKDMNNIYARSIEKTKNCLDIQYDSNNILNKDSSGMFHFSMNSTNEDLKILVSPMYRSSDDLLTAVLLIHEITHANNYATGLENSISCYEDEALAFTNEFGFFVALTNEERSSILGRYGKSQEADQFINFWYYLAKQSTDLNGKVSGDSLFNSSLKYVKSSKFYQNQCKSNEINI